MDLINSSSARGVKSLKNYAFRFSIEIDQITVVVT